MPELPEITVIARQMRNELIGKVIEDIEVRQPKILNLRISEFEEAVEGKRISEVSSRGKWIFIKLDPGHLVLLNLGMGAELLYFTPQSPPSERCHFKLTFRDGSGFTSHFSWFGYIHAVREGDLPKHKLTAQLGVSPTEERFTEEWFSKVLLGKKTGVKSFLLDQKNMAGIGNVYVQDILFRARLHPNRKTSTLSYQEVKKLYDAILETLNQSIDLGGLTYEKDFYGKNGRFTSNQFLVGYKEGKPCPACGTVIQKIRTGSTASYICPNCQKI